MFILLAVGAQAEPPTGAQWKRLQNNPVPVDCTEVGGRPWCRSAGVIGASPDTVAGALERMREGSSDFESIVSVRKLADDTIHVVLDYPTGVSDRDYVAKYTREIQSETYIYRWTPVVHDDAPEVQGVVRLPRYEGSWVLEPHTAGALVTYTWQAEVGGSLPTFLHERAWKTAGKEALKDLASTAGAELSAP